MTMRRSFLQGGLSVLLLAMSYASARGQAKQTELEAAARAGFDPNFVETRDTISRKGPWHITRDVLEDKRGNIWFATWHGIVKYDGRLFTNHTLKDGLIHFHVVSLYEDRSGNIWFGTARGGLYRYNGKTFKLFTTRDGLADNSVLCMAEDREGNIWFGTENGGVSRYNGKTFTSFTAKNGLSGDHVNAVIADRTGKLWFGTMDGISIYDGKTFTTFTSGNKPVKKVLSLFEDKAGNIWIGTFDGLRRYDGKVVADFLSPYLTYYFAGDKQGNIWFTHSEPNTRHANVPNQVLYRYDGTRFTKVLEKNGPNDFQLFGKMVDSKDNVWFGTMHGPCRYDGREFTYFGQE